MCTLVFAHRAHAEYPLVIAANRDEFYRRPTAAAEFWTEAPTVLAGRDLQAGGTWLGITKTGRWAGLTNIRTAHNNTGGKRTRGELVTGFLLGDARPAAYVNDITHRGADYDRFNLLVGDRSGVWYVSNHESGTSRSVRPGVHGVSNHLLDTPWPKVRLGCSLVQRTLFDIDEQRVDSMMADRLLEGFADRRRFDDDTLPETGVGIEMERVFSPLFIALSDYGTCSSTVITVHRSGRVDFVERTTNPTIRDAPTRVYRFDLSE